MGQQDNPLFAYCKHPHDKENYCLFFLSLWYYKCFAQYPWLFILH